eukprot:4612650-Amphidinium_carterae.1
MVQQNPGTYLLTRTDSPLVATCDSLVAHNQGKGRGRREEPIRTRPGLVAPSDNLVAHNKVRRVR